MLLRLSDGFTLSLAFPLEKGEGMIFPSPPVGERVRARGKSDPAN